MKRSIFILFILFLLTACTSQTATESAGDTTVSPATNPPANTASRPTPTNVPAEEPDEPTAVPQATAEVVIVVTDTAVSDTPPPAPETLDPISDLTIVADDGTPIATTLYLPEGDGPFPGVMLLHMLGARRQDWEERGLTEMLTEAGYAVLAVDMRGHGETPGSRDWDVIEQDLMTVWQEFSEMAQVDGENTAVVGGSIGSNMALITGDNIPEIQTVILLSPGLDYRGVTTDDRIESYGERPILIVASAEDKYAADSSQTLLDLASENAELSMLNGAGHGTNMLTQTAVRQEIVAWLDANLK